MKPVQTVSLVGTGKLAWHLGKAFLRSGCRIIEVAGRHSEEAEKLAQELNAKVIKLEEGVALQADLVMIAVSDDVVGQVSAQLQPFPGITAHCSGIHGPEVLNDKHEYAACFYPLQSFSKGDQVKWDEIPILIQAPDKAVQAALFELGQRLSNTVLNISSDQKKHLHLAAVFANNYSNAMYSEAAQIMQDAKLDFKLLMPLIRKTVDKLNVLSPDDAQTGPAKRNDLSTMQNHLDLLDNEELKELYQLIAKRISNRQGD